MEKVLLGAVDIPNAIRIARQGGKAVAKIDKRFFFAINGTYGRSKRGS
jgi:hypothetical protein